MLNFGGFATQNLEFPQHFKTKPFMLNYKNKLILKL